MSRLASNLKYGQRSNKKNTPANSLSPGSKDVFVLTVKGRDFIVPRQSFCLIESGASCWVIRTPYGDFQLANGQSILKLVSQGRREFEVEPIEYGVALVRH